MILYVTWMLVQYIAAQQEVQIVWEEQIAYSPFTTNWEFGMTNGAKFIVHV
jgi:hypothetical protein